MKIAIVHDSLVEFGGAERVLQSLLALYPTAHVYVAYADIGIIKSFFPKLKSDHLHTSWVNNTVFSRHGSLFQLVSPLVWRSFNLTAYDIVLSVTSYLSANLVSPGKAIHLQYVHSLPKNLYGIDEIYPLQRILPYSPLLRMLIQQSLSASPYIISNSQNIQNVILQKTGIQSTIIYPPVQIPKTTIKRRRPIYYLVVARIDRSKSIELAIKACNALKVHLKIVGQSNEPAYESYLRSIAGPTIEFLGFIPDADVTKLYEHAKAFIFTAKNEDFGIAPVEAMAHGVPVIAYGSGGLKETIRHTVTGILFNEHTEEALSKAITQSNQYRFSAKILRKHAQQFSHRNFLKQINQIVQHAILHNHKGSL